MEVMKKTVLIPVACSGEICNWEVLLRTDLEIERVYTKKFTLLRIRPVMISGVILVIVNSLISIHLARNPANGGKPARFAMIIISIHFSFLVFGDVLIFFLV